MKKILKKIITLAIAGVLFMSLMLGCVQDEEELSKTDGDIWAEMALEQTKLVYKTFWKDVGDGDVYVTSFVPAKAGESEKAYLWPYMEYASMCARLLTVLPESTIIDGTKTLVSFYKDVMGGLVYYKDALRSTSEFAVYNSGRGLVPGFGTGAPYYDDNLWVAREFINAYELLKNDDGTKNAGYLAEAERIAAFVWSGWDTEHGGIRWLEPTNTEYGITRNTCSNAPSVSLFVRLYGHTQKQDYITRAKACYDFAKEKLRNPENGLYWDSVKYNQSTGKDVVDKMLWSYGSGCMISAAIDLYEAETDAEKKAEYMEDALFTAEGAFNYFAIKERSLYYYPATPWFNLLLLEGYVKLYSHNDASKYIDSFYDTLKYSYQNKKDEAGFMPLDWSGGWGTGADSTPRNSLEMASNAECLGYISYAINTKDYGRS